MPAMIFVVTLVCMLLGALCIAFGPEHSWLFVAGLAFIAAVPWLIWVDLRRARKRFRAELDRAYAAEAERQRGVVPAKTPEEVDQARLAASLEPPRYRPGQFGEGEFRSLSGRWKVVTMVTNATAELEGNEAIWSGTCEYVVTDTQSDFRLDHSERDSPPSPSFRFADDERSIRLGEREFDLPA